MPPCTICPSAVNVLDAQALRIATSVCINSTHTAQGTNATLATKKTMQKKFQEERPRFHHSHDVIAINDPGLVDHLWKITRTFFITSAEQKSRSQLSLSFISIAFH